MAGPERRPILPRRPLIPDPDDAPVYVAWRPTEAAAALGLAVEYLAPKAAFARLPFGAWAQTLFWQAARKHYLFALDSDRRIAGFIGWALTEARLADGWLKGEAGLSNEQCLAGDCVILNAWAAESEAASAFLQEAAASLFAGKAAIYFKRHYRDGRERAIRLSIPGHRRSPRKPRID